MKARRGRVGVWGHFHGGNIGDDIVVATLIANIRSRLPDYEIHAFSLNPSDTARRHGVPSSALSGGPVFPAATPEHAWSDDPDEDMGSSSQPPPAMREESSPARRAIDRLKQAPGARFARQFLHWARPRLSLVKRILRDLAKAPRIYRQLRALDAVFVAGSGPVFDDMGGTWEHPYNLLRWTLLSRIAGTRFCLLNVGAGPINQDLSRKFLSWALNLSHYHSFRDVSSAELAKELGVKKPSPVYCDMAFAVPESEIEAARTGAIVGTRPRVGVAPMAYMDGSYWHNADEGVADRYLEALAALSVWLLSENYDLVLLKSQRSADRRTALRLLEKVKSLIPSLDQARIDNPATSGHSDLLRQMAGCRYVVGGRFHCHVLPFLLNIPVLGVSYHPKTDELMHQMGQHAYFAQMDNVSGEALMRMFRDLRANSSNIVDKVREQSAAQRRILRQQFDELFSIEFIG